MDLCEAWGEAKNGEKIRRLKTRATLEKGCTISFCATIDDLETDDWEIVGRWPVPTEPGLYFCKNNGKVWGINLCHDGDKLQDGFGRLISSYSESIEWGLRQDPPPEWTSDGGDG